MTQLETFQTLIMMAEIWRRGEKGRAYDFSVHEKTIVFQTSWPSGMVCEERCEVVGNVVLDLARVFEGEPER